MDKDELINEDKLPLAVLVVDDEPDFADAMAETLEQIDAVCTVVHSREEAEKAIDEKIFDVVMTDLMLDREKEQDDGGLQILRRIKEVAPETEVILMTANSRVEIAVEAMKLGAYNYLTKPPESLNHLREVVRKAGESSRLRRLNREMRERLDEKFGFNGVIGNSPAMLRAVDRLKRIAPTDATVLILGETGTGKELFAQAIHQNSPRKNRPFVALNCAALSENILESELFGHVKGAFTDATANRIGKFEYAQGGTIFLDEVGDMPLPTQVKLLRVLENHEITRVGSNETIKVNVRIISATNQNLEEAVANHTLREDLYHRLKVVTLRIPPLRERVGDIPILLDSFLRSFAKKYGKTVKGVSQSARRKLFSYDWPGNVRQLKNAAESMVAVDMDELIDDDDLPEEIPGAVEGNIPESSAAVEAAAPSVASLVGLSMPQVEQMMIEETLRACGGNRDEAARILGTSPRSLYRRLKVYKGGGTKEPKPKEPKAKKPKAKGTKTKGAKAGKPGAKKAKAEVTKPEEPNAAKD
ncbi:MAG: sigma-54-dependent Fis family transcriptional regulator [Thermoguttaceae bacterium]|nr:sigma-54-dependent Fis family transcriptional regulator [Thermoguttaceae bacterium]